MTNNKQHKLRRFLELFMLGMIVLNVCIAFTFENRAPKKNNSVAEISENCDSACHEQKLKLEKQGE